MDFVFVLVRSLIGSFKLSILLASFKIGLKKEQMDE